VATAIPLPHSARRATGCGRPSSSLASQRVELLEGLATPAVSILWWRVGLDGAEARAPPSVGPVMDQTSSNKEMDHVLAGSGRPVMAGGLPVFSASAGRSSVSSSADRAPRAGRLPVPHHESGPGRCRRSTPYAKPLHSASPAVPVTHRFATKNASEAPARGKVGIDAVTQRARKRRHGPRRHL
jgi:hypothetical protein